MNAVSYSWERFQDLGFAKRPRQDCASANAEKGTSKVNKVHWFVVAVVFVVVYYGTPVSASRVDAFACDSRPNAFAILLARWKYVAVRLHRSLSIRSRIFVAVAVYYLEIFVFYAAFVPQFRNTSVAVSTLDADDLAIVRIAVVLDDPVRSQYSPAAWAELGSEKY